MVRCRETSAASAPGRVAPKGRPTSPCSSSTPSVDGAEVTGGRFPTLTWTRPLPASFGTLAPQGSASTPSTPSGVCRRTASGEVRSEQPLESRKSNTDAKRSELLTKHATGQFTPAVERAFQRNPALVGKVAEQVLHAHFPASLHDAILAAVALDPKMTTQTRRARDPRFRDLVLTAYRHECAVCGFGLTVGHATACVEAAHIKWHQAGGPDLPQNGLALCSVHHKLFDLGAYTVDAPKSVGARVRPCSWTLPRTGTATPPRPADSCASAGSLRGRAQSTSIGTGTRCSKAYHWTDPRVGV